MTKTLYMHIGLPKTGSTSLQSFLYKNQELLKTQDVCFANFYSFPGGGHSSLVAYASLETGSKISPLTKTSSERIVGSKLENPDYKTKFRKLLEASIKATETSKLIITSESFYTQIRDLRQILALKEFLSEYFHKIIIVAYLRPQESWIASRLSQTAKLGQTHKVDKLINARVNDYHRTLKPWWETFGKQNMRFRILEKTFLHKGDLISDFANLMGVKITSDFKIPNSTNLSLSADMISFLQVFNQYIPSYLEGNLRNPAREGLLEIIENYSSGKERYSINSETTKIIRKQFLNSNENLRKEFFPERTKLFATKDDIISKSGNLSSDTAIEIAAYLWKQQQLKIQTIQEENLLLSHKNQIHRK